MNATTQVTIAITLENRLGECITLKTIPLPQGASAAPLHATYKARVFLIDPERWTIKAGHIEATYREEAEADNLNVSNVPVISTQREKAA